MIARDLAKAIPEGFYGQIARWSGLVKCDIVVHNGTTDWDYRGEVCAVLFNLSNEEYTVRTGNRITQLIIQRYIAPKFVSITEFTTKTGEGR